MTVLTHEDQPLVGAIARRNIPTFGARLTGMVGIDFDSHTAVQGSFVGNIAMQLGKSPLGDMTVRPSLLPGGFLAMCALRALTDVCQIFQPDETVWMLGDNAMTDGMVHSLFQPSLPSTDDDKSPRCGTGAFFLQPFGQSRIVIGFGAYCLARIESGLPSRIGRDGQVALSYIHTNDIFVRLRSWVSYLNLKGNKQVKLLAGLVIPELSGSDMGILLEQSHMLAIACVGHDHTALQCENAHLGIFLQAIVPMEVVGECGRHVLRWLIQPLVTFPGFTRLAQVRILLHLRPESLIGGPDLTGDIAGHLCRQTVGRTDVHVGFTLQPHLIARLTVCKSIAADRVQSVSVCQLRSTQGFELIGRGMQFELGSEHLFHSGMVAHVHIGVKPAHSVMKNVNVRGISSPCLKTGDSLPLEVENSPGPAAPQPVEKRPTLDGLRFDWTVTILCMLLVGGVWLDNWAHNHGRVDNTFFTPWHAVLYSVFILAAVFLTTNLLRNHGKGYPWREALPPGYGLSFFGVIVFVCFVLSCLARDEGCGLVDEPLDGLDCHGGYSWPVGQLPVGPAFDPRNYVTVEMQHKRRQHFGGASYVAFQLLLFHCFNCLVHNLHEILLDASPANQRPIYVGMSHKFTDIG